MAAYLQPQTLPWGLRWRFGRTAPRDLSWRDGLHRLHVCHAAILLAFRTLAAEKCVEERAFLPQPLSFSSQLLTVACSSR
jgi:hypothetical protein